MPPKKVSVEWDFISELYCFVTHLTLSWFTTRIRFSSHNIFQLLPTHKCPKKEFIQSYGHVVSNVRNGGGENRTYAKHVIFLLTVYLLVVVNQ